MSQSVLSEYPLLRQLLEELQAIAARQRMADALRSPDDREEARRRTEEEREGEGRD